jgi:hypothetical protein
MSAIDEITALAAEYYALVRRDHHKDRDCHWYIETRWSYDQPPKYIARHYGYVTEELDAEHGSYREALVALRAYLREAIAAQKAFNECEEFAAMMEETK